eukprot:NODE_7180_length_602_cov_60.627368_g7157_i0.p1 GENE.NODE_7180_length_602_cov_60.627368_g7157_i0~~NODE_7180_length_602_cov_60.627368_g7157_i0.p1  ORF type:complete len:137 (-),score=30.66 NODE_7180_length_602_cov_60.627368_g7157_i0:190-564(-)
MDLVDAHEQQVGGTAVNALMRGVNPPNDLYSLASPIELLPYVRKGGPATSSVLEDNFAFIGLVHADGDAHVPVRQSERFLSRAAEAGTRTEYRYIEGEEHFAHLRVDSKCWAAALELIDLALKE